MSQHSFRVSLTGGEVREPMIHFFYANTDEKRTKLEEDVFGVLNRAGFVFIETKYVGPDFIPELGYFDHYFKCALGKIMYSQDQFHGLDFIHADNQPGVIETVAAFLAEDKNFHMLQAEDLNACDENNAS